MEAPDEYSYKQYVQRIRAAIQDARSQKCTPTIGTVVSVIRGYIDWNYQYASFQRNLDRSVVDGYICQIPRSAIGVQHTCTLFDCQRYKEEKAFLAPSPKNLKRIVALMMEFRKSWYPGFNIEDICYLFAKLSYAGLSPEELMPCVKEGLRDLVEKGEIVRNGGFYKLPGNESSEPASDSDSSEVPDSNKDSNEGSDDDVKEINGVKLRSLCPERAEAAWIKKFGTDGVDPKSYNWPWIPEEKIVEMGKKLAGSSYHAARDEFDYLDLGMRKHADGLERLPAGLEIPSVRAWRISGLVRQGDNGSFDTVEHVDFIRKRAEEWRKIEDKRVEAYREKRKAEIAEEVRAEIMAELKLKKRQGTTGAPENGPSASEMSAGSPSVSRMT